MTRRTAARGRVGFLRRWALRRASPLRRPLRPAERLTAAVLTGLVLLSAAGTAAGAVITNAMAGRDARAFRATAHTVRATVVGPRPPAGADLSGGPVSYPVRVRWTWHGQVRTASLLLYTDPALGSPARAWVDSAGRLISPPWPAASTDLPPTAVAAGGALATAALAWGSVASFRAWLLRRRARLWEEEWARVGPLWTGRRGTL